MLTVGTSSAIAANTTTNVVLGTPLEFIGAPSAVRLLLVSDNVGLQAQFLINVGGMQIVPLAAGTPINVSPNIGQGPRDDEDTYIAQVMIPAGARCALNVTNTTGAAVTMRWRAFIAP